MSKIFKNRCYNGGNMHNFKPRHTERERHGNLEIERASESAIHKLMTLRVYVGDVCTWCGKVINNPNE